MIYRCEGKSCLYLFEADLPELCPDCGSKNIHPATKEEQAEYQYYRRQYGCYGKESAIDQ